MVYVLAAIWGVSVLGITWLVVASLRRQHGGEDNEKAIDRLKQEPKQHPPDCDQDRP